MATFGGRLSTMDKDAMHLSVNGDVDLLNGDDDMSPVRRSTRASAVRAQEKMRSDDDIENGYLTTASSYANVNGLADGGGADATASAEPVDPEREANRVYVGATIMDQMDSNFAIQLGANGRPVLMSEESDMTLSEEDRAKLRTKFAAIAHREPTSEQMLERKRMIAQLKARLRLEEANLLLLKQLRQSQRDTSASQSAAKTATTSGVSRANMNVTAQQRAQNYKQSVPANTSSLDRQRQAALAAMMKTQLGTATPPAPKQPPPAHQNSRGATAQRPAAPVDPAAERITAKLQLKRQLEKTLLAIPPPTPPPTNVDFVPNPSATDFVILHGLDQVVQKVLRDKTITNPKMPDPWTCAQCGTDFTPSWYVTPKAKKPKLDVDAKPPAPAAESADDAAALAKTEASADVDVDADASTSTADADKKEAAAEDAEATPMDTSEPVDKAAAADDEDVEYTFHCESCSRNNHKKRVRNAQTAKFKQEFVKALKAEQELAAMKDGNIDWPKLGLAKPATPQPQQSHSSRGYGQSASSSQYVNGHSSQGVNMSYSNGGHSKSKPSSSSASAAQQALRQSQQFMQNMHNPSAMAAQLLQTNNMQNAMMSMANPQLVQLMQAALQPQTAQRPAASGNNALMQQMAVLMQMANMPSMPKDVLNNAMQQRFIMDMAQGIKR